MPSAPKKECRYLGCTTKTSKGYCDEHKENRYNWSSTSDPWYNKPIWKGNPNKPLGQRGGLREQHLLKEPYCRMCKENGIINNVTGKGKGVVDHIIPFRSVAKHLQWKYFTDPNNFQTLCKHHDATKTAKQ